MNGKGLLFDLWLSDEETVHSKLRSFSAVIRDILIGIILFVYFGEAR